MGAGASIDADLAAAAGQGHAHIERLSEDRERPFDPTRADPDAVREVVDARKLAGTATRSRVLLQEDGRRWLLDTSRLSDDHADEPPRCAGEFASAEALAALAARHGPALLESLHSTCKRRGELRAGPQSGSHRPEPITTTRTPRALRDAERANAPSTRRAT